MRKIKILRNRINFQISTAALAGVAIYRSGAFGNVYGHGGWIPGYCSSLRYYPDYGISIAFQINTDIGIVDFSTPSIREMEIRLAEIVISGNGGINIMK